jgi:HK97 family phage major capsid protein
MTKELRIIFAALNEKKDQVKALLVENKVADAEKLMAEVRDLQKKADLQTEIDAQDSIDISADKGGIPAPAKVDHIKNFVNGLRTHFKNALSTDVPADGGYTVPQDIQTTVNELRQTKDALQNFITVENVSAPTGSRVFKARSQQTGFAVVAENGTITEKSTPQFTQLTYSVLKYAGFLKVTNELLKDSDAAIVSTVAQWIGDESRVTRNKIILAELDKKAKTALTDTDSIKEVLNIQLDPAFRYTSSVVTNQDGYNYLDKLKATDGTYLLQPNVTSPTGKQLFGVPVVMVSNADLPTVLTKAPFIIGDLKAAVSMYALEGLSIMSSDVAGDAYLTDVTLFRAIEREVVKTKDTEAFVYGELTIA